jgi:flagellar motor switch protein FliN/FliY
MTDIALDHAISKLMDAFGKPWADALSRLMGTSCKVGVQTGTISDHGDQPLCLGISFDGLLVGDAILIVPSADLKILSQKSCDSPRDDAESSSEGADPAVQQNLRQSLVAALQDFQTNVGPLVGRIDACQMPSWTPQKTLVLEATSEDRPSVRTYLLCNDNLRINHLAATSRANGLTNASEHFNVVMNASLEVTLRFGQQSITLSKLASLGPGSVIELDRKVEEPIDLVLGGRVLARGEVMIVDGNYGLRVTELLDRSQL